MLDERNLSLALKLAKDEGVETPLAALAPRPAWLTYSESS
jgi:hypothetical protein